MRGSLAVPPLVPASHFVSGPVVPTMTEVICTAVLSTALFFLYSSLHWEELTEVKGSVVYLGVPSVAHESVLLNPADLCMVQCHGPTKEHFHLSYAGKLYWCTFHCFLSFLNSQKRDIIRFTYEVEEEGALPFLDTLVIRSSEGSLESRVYRKPTHTDQILDFKSHHPRSVKASVIFPLIKRNFAVS